MVDQTDPWLSLKAVLLRVFQKNSGMVLVPIRSLATSDFPRIFCFFLFFSLTLQKHYWPRHLESCDPRCGNAALESALAELDRW